MFGLFRIEDTCTYLPPIWDSTLAYSFSAPIALITVDDLAEAAFVALRPAAGHGHGQAAAAAPASTRALYLRGNLRAAASPAVLTIRRNIV